MSRRDRRANDPEVQSKKEAYKAASILGPPGGGNGSITSGKGTGGGWGVGNSKVIPATGTHPTVNPFMIPKDAGINIVSKTFPSDYYVNWDLSTWRSACDQAIKFGNPFSYATLTSWVYECSPFVRSLFRALESPLGKIPFLAVDTKGNELPEWTAELCNRAWQIELRKKVGMSHFWGFCGINYDPVMGKVYKYPMQDLDPINRMLRSSTYSYFDGVKFEEFENLLFVQPSTDYEAFLGWMQPIARSFIQMNLNKNNWISAGRRLAFPLMTVGYPQDDSAIDPVTGLGTNPYKLQAEAVVQNADPSRGLVYPYTKDAQGNIVKSLEIEFENPGSQARAHAIYSDFNDSEKNEIREMILGGTLTADVGKSGSRALGSVHEDKLETVIMDMVDFVASYMNDEWLPKISKFYKNFPAGIQLQANKAKQLSIDDIQKLSTVLQASGKRLTDDFFVANGLSKDFFEDAPTPGGGFGSSDDDDTEFSAAIPGRVNLSSKKKF
jgi:hypothetical protein